MPTIKDEDLIRKIHAEELAQQLIGQPSSSAEIFSTIIERHHENFSRLLHIRYPVDADAVSDIMQDFWSQCFQSLPRYNPDKPFLSWATTLLFRAAEKFIRLRQREVEISPQSGFFDQIAANSDASEFSKNLSHQNLLNALRQLPPDLLQLIEMRYFQEKKIDEMVELTGISRSSIFDKLNLAYRKLKRELE